MNVSFGQNKIECDSERIERRIKCTKRGVNTLHYGGTRACIHIAFCARMEPKSTRGIASCRSALN